MRLIIFVVDDDKTYVALASRILQFWAKDLPHIPLDIKKFEDGRPAIDEFKKMAIEDDMHVVFIVDHNMPTNGLTTVEEIKKTTLYLKHANFIKFLGFSEDYNKCLKNEITDKFSEKTLVTFDAFLSKEGMTPVGWKKELDEKLSPLLETKNKRRRLK